MGMFDYIRVEVPLPDRWASNNLQTKDFDCEMVEHVITKDGRLMLSRIDSTEVVPKEERPYPNETGLLAWAGSIRTHTSLRDSNFHGIVNFYGSEGGAWHEYNAKFTDGQLTGIELCEDSN